MKIGIIAAMEEEIKEILRNNEYSIIDNINDQNVYTVNKKNKFIIFTTGIGKLNATITTTLAIKKYDFDLIINIGTSGKLTNLPIGSLIVGEKLAFFDVDATIFGYDYGQIPREELYEYINNDQNLVKKINEKIDNIFVGTILTGDSFVTKENKEKFNINFFDNPLAVEMESMAIVRTAHKLNKKIYVFRTISDDGDNIEFNKYLNLVCLKYNDIFNIIDEYYS